MWDVFDDVRNVDHRIAARDTETKVVEEQQLHQALQAQWMCGLLAYGRYRHFSRWDAGTRLGLASPQEWRIDPRLRTVSGSAMDADLAKRHARLARFRRATRSGYRRRADSGSFPARTCRGAS